MKSPRSGCAWFLPSCVYRLAWIVAAVTFLSSVPTSRGDEPRPPSRYLSTLTQAEKIRELSTQQANRGYPVRLHGVVTYIDDFALFLQDSSAGIAALAPGLSHTVHAGDLVELNGITECPDFAPQINNVRVRVIGEARMPVAKSLSFEQLASTEEDSQWAEVEGIVQAVVQDEIPIPPAVDLSR